MRPLIASPLVALAIGCSAALDAPGPHAPLTVTRLRADPFSFTYFSQIRQPERLVIRDQVTWGNAWASLSPLGASIASPPNVDFDHEMIVLVALGERSTGGYSILVDSAGTNTDGITVWVGTSAPGAHCVTTQAFTQPVDVAKLPRIDAPVRFVGTSRVIDCQ